MTDIFTEETPRGSILVNDHLLIFAFWVVAYRRFHCNFFFCFIPLSLGASQVWITGLLIYKFQPVNSIILFVVDWTLFYILHFRFYNIAFLSPISHVVIILHFYINCFLRGVRFLLLTKLSPLFAASTEIKICGTN